MCNHRGSFTTHPHTTAPRVHTGFAQRKGRIEMDDEVDEAVQEKRKSAYSSRLSRARAFNADKRGGLIKGPGTQFDSPANMAFSIPVQAEADAAAATTPRPSGAGARTAAPRTPSVAKASDSAQVFYRPEEEGGVAAHWEWNPVQKLLALVEHTQLLKVIDETGKTIYRVQVCDRRARGPGCTIVGCASRTGSAFARAGPCGPRRATPRWWLSAASPCHAAMPPHRHTATPPRRRTATLPTRPMAFMRRALSLCAHSVCPCPAAARGTEYLPGVGTIGRGARGGARSRRRVPVVSVEARLCAAVGGHAVLVAGAPFRRAQA